MANCIKRKFDALGHSAALLAICHACHCLTMPEYCIGLVACWLRCFVGEWKELLTKQLKMFMPGTLHWGHWGSPAFIPWGWNDWTLTTIANFLCTRSFDFLDVHSTILQELFDGTLCQVVLWCQDQSPLEFRSIPHTSCGNLQLRGADGTQIGNWWTSIRRVNVTIPLLTSPSINLLMIEGRQISSISQIGIVLYFVNILSHLVSNFADS